ncbi:hypothetical protein FQZ97_694970 [compost metagenome]
MALQFAAEGAGAISDRIHVRRGRPAALVHHHAVQADEPGRLGQRRLGDRADRHQHQVRVRLGSIGQMRAPACPRALPPRHRRAVPYLDARVVVKGADARCGRFGYFAAHDTAALLQHQNLSAQLARRTGGLQPQVSRPQHQQAAAGPQGLAQAARIVQAAHRVDALARHAGNATGPRAGRQHAMLVAHPASGPRVQHVPGCVQALHRIAGHDGHARLLVRAIGAQGDAFLAGGARQQGLG